MIYVIETSNGVVLNVAGFPTVEGFNTRKAAEDYAKHLCGVNGVIFEGNISCDGSVKDYSVQILGQQ